MNRMSYSTWSVRHILGLDPGPKTRTSRLMKPQDPALSKPRYKVGEVVAMGEALVRKLKATGYCGSATCYAADGAVWRPRGVAPLSWRWKVNKLPSIYMPLWAARRWLRITDIRAERMLDISEEDALAEGLSSNHAWSGAGWHKEWRASDGKWYSDHTAAFAATIAAHNPKLGPEDNPWLFAYTLEQVERPT